jgi:hypothetical protein
MWSNEEFEYIGEYTGKKVGKYICKYIDEYLGEYVGELDFIFETNLGYESGDQVGCFW